MDAEKPAVTIDELVAKANTVAEEASETLAQAQSLAVLAAGIALVAFWVGRRLGKRSVIRNDKKRNGS